jgi:25S rRNA (uracil2634-N3)-methyltransferase
MRNIETEIGWVNGDFAYNPLLAPFGDILLVGEGNFSFTRSLVASRTCYVRTIIATAFEARQDLSDETKENIRRLVETGVEVFDEMDATKIHRVFSQRAFDMIIFQFPNVACREPVEGRNPNYILVRDFFASARRILRPSGCIVVTTVDSPYYQGAFQMNESAMENDLKIIGQYDFSIDDFPGYSHMNTHDQDSALDSKARLTSSVMVHK